MRSFLVDNIGHLAHTARARPRWLSFRARRSPRSQPFKKQMGWIFPWYSSFGSDFNYDFHVTLDENVAPVEYNYRDKAAHEKAGMPWFTKRASCRA